MLVLTRKAGERIQIGENIWVTVVRVESGQRVVLAIEAPRDVPITRPDAFVRPPAAPVAEGT